MGPPTLKVALGRKTRLPLASLVSEPEIQLRRGCAVAEGKKPLLSKFPATELTLAP